MELKHGLKLLPPNRELETTRVLKQLVRSNKVLAELKGYARTMPNQHILINAITINEAKDSSAIENIITTYDELYKAMTVSKDASNSAKEVINYRSALWKGYNLVKEKGYINTNIIVDIQKEIEHNNAGIRKLPGTVLKNAATGETIYSPPDVDEVLEYMKNLDEYINEEDSIDPLIKLAIIHYQFESIHPFYDGNGRTGRIINILYLILNDLLDSPILYLSKYIIRNKSQYYEMFTEIRKTGSFEEWILYFLIGIEEMAEETMLIIRKIQEEMSKMQEELREQLPKIYSKELLETLFYEFYTKLPYMQKSLGISQRTAITYLDKLEENHFLSSEKIGRERIYKNERLFKLIKEADKI
ncbi:MAG: Fic family protein [Firmicutes bacterium]|nr:Fic family protein [Bacillota bacterium]